MISAPLTPDEKDRLNALYGYNILDTEAEKVFDDLTLLASEICDTPIALISLIDPDRQWFKSKVGIDAEETSRDIAFCAHAIHEREIFEITDASKDERFSDNPLVTDGPNIRFYAGTQLVTPNGYAIGTLCTISDKPKKLTDSQINALEILGREVISQMELRRNLKEAQSANAFKTEFLSSMSHEIRTPLNAIIGFSQIVLEKSQELELPAELKSYINDIDFSSQHLLHIVNSVLDLNKIEAGKMELQNQWFSTQNFIEKLCNMMAIKVKDKGINLSFEVDSQLPEYLFLDEVKLNQILINLLNNSIKFTEKNKRVYLMVNYIKDQICFTIKDQGVGIAQNDQAKLFSKFQQVGNSINEGTGLGLVITKSLTELMGGKIDLSSEEGSGTNVNVYLPISDEKVPDSMTVESPAKHRKKINQPVILVVEDNAINRKLANVMFKSLGHTVDFAVDGETSIKMVNEKNYDVIYMDIHMPGINGIEAAQIIKASHSAIPIIALTADIFEIQKKQDNDFKFDYYLSKPLLKNELCESFDKVLT